MNVCMEDVRVHNDHAIRCSIVCKPVNVLEYVKAVSKVVGASQILAVFEEKDSVKIYLNEKRFVDTLVRSCLHVMGYHIKVDYASPPGTRLILTDVDPIISNYDIMRLLSVYGTVVSPVIRPPISDDTALCHIGSGVRYVYMNLANGSVPERIEFKYGENMFSFKIQAETADIVVISNMKVDTFDESLQDNENSNSSVVSEDTPPILVSVQSVNSLEDANASPPKLPNPFVAMNLVASSEKKRRGRPPGSANRMRMAQKITATSKAARKIQRKVKHKWMRRGYKKGNANKQLIKTASLRERAVRILSSSSSSHASSVRDVSTATGETKDDSCKVLEKERLLEFLREVKNNRTPIEMAKKYFGDDCDSVNKLIEQLGTFRKEHQVDASLRSRIWRLLKSLRESLNTSSQSIPSETMD